MTHVSQKTRHGREALFPTAHVKDLVARHGSTAMASPFHPGARPHHRSGSAASRSTLQRASRSGQTATSGAAPTGSDVGAAGSGAWVQKCRLTLFSRQKRARLLEQISVAARDRARPRSESTISALERRPRSPRSTAPPSLSSSVRLGQAWCGRERWQTGRTCATTAAACSRGAPCVRASSTHLEEADGGRMAQAARPRCRIAAPQRKGLRPLDPYAF